MPRISGIAGIDEAVTPAKAVKLLLSDENCQRKSKDRIRRVRDEGRGSGMMNASGADSITPDVIAKVDQLLVMVSTKYGVTLVLVNPLSFTSDSGKVTQVITQEELKRPETKVRGVILSSKVERGDNDQDIIVVPKKTGSMDHILYFKGNTCAVCDPSCVEVSDGEFQWQLAASTLNFQLQTQWTESQISNPSHLVKIKPDLEFLLSFIDDTRLLVVLEDGEATLNVASMSSGKASACSSGDANKINCLICGKEWPKEMIRHHIGSHILSKNWANLGKDRPKFPCGVCGVNDAIGVKPSKTAVGSCHVWQTAGGNLGFKCQQQPLFKMKVGSAEGCKVNFPCTNRPIQCPESQCGSVVWSYSMKDHYQHKHKKEM